jgi:hypothetical protein
MNLRKPLFLLPLLSALTALPVIAAQASIEPTGHGPTVYQFLGDRAPEAGAVTEARIEYEVDGRTIYTEHFSFRIEAGSSATFPVPDPADLAGFAASSEAQAKVEIHVYVGDTLIDSFDAAGFRAYNERLRQTDPAAVAPFSRTRNGEPRQARVGQAPARPPSAASTPELAPKSLLDPCVQACRQEYMACVKSGYWGCDLDWNYCLADCPNYDSDGDGVLNGNDNCVFTSNANQADCDGDGAGNVCDNLNANYQTIIPEQTCWTDKDTHTLLYITFEHHVEWLERDVSSCGAPDRWRNRIRQDNDCVNISDFDCCWGLRYSISAVGDDPYYWCSGGVRNVNFCH